MVEVKSSIFNVSRIFTLAMSHFKLIIIIIASKINGIP
jgi:hypothetical protein